MVYSLWIILLILLKHKENYELRPMNYELFFVPLHPLFGTHIKERW